MPLPDRPLRGLLPRRLNIFARLLPALLAFAAAHGTVLGEFRAAWIATVHNLDWPSRAGLSPAQQQAELRSQLDFAKRLGLNAIIFQVRPAADALYASRNEPWSPYLTGTMGRNPGYDPLAVAVAEAHRRGLELHAWFNPYRAIASKSVTPSRDHISRRKPDWIRRHGTNLWIDPGAAGVEDYTIGVILDAARRYDIDGVHLDDYFYPYPVKGAREFDDSASYNAYRKRGGRLERGDWRRANVDRFVQRLHRELKSLKPGLKFGISPFGIWRPGVPDSIKAGLDAYGTLAADSRKWLQEGWVDYLAPQLYWNIDPPDQSFATLLKWWTAQSARGRPIWPGIAVDRVGKSRPASEIARQIELTRRTGASSGHILWSLKDVRANRGGVADLLRNSVYR